MRTEKVTKEPKGRPQRSPVSHRDRLRVYEQDPNYVYRWVWSKEGVGDNVGLREEQGYEIVPNGTHRIGNQRVSTAAPVGSATTIPAGDGAQLILMRILKEYYDEDQDRKVAENTERMKAMLKVPDGFYGKITT